MLIKFHFGNYKSFRDKFVLSALASSLKGLEDTNTTETGRERLLKSLNIFGANASGKTNILQAIVNMRWMVINSSKNTQYDEEIDVDAFRLNTETAKKPSFFEIEFLMDDIRFRYGYSASKSKIHAEWLFVTTKVKEYPLFVRRGVEIEVFDRFQEGNGLTKKTRPNALFLSVVAQFNGDIARRIVLWFARIIPIYGLETIMYAGGTLNLLEDSEEREHIKRLIKNVDLGISDILIEDGRVFTVHKKYNKEGDFTEWEKFNLLSDESAGTQKFFNIIGHMHNAIRKGQVVIIDELDARLHPLLTKTVVRLFNSKANKKGQLVFATHDTNLLDQSLLRRDQIYIVEKQEKGNSELRSIAEFKIRRDAVLDRNYMKGRYGGIPFINDLEDALTV